MALGQSVAGRSVADNRPPIFSSGQSVAKGKSVAVQSLWTIGRQSNIGVDRMSNSEQFPVEHDDDVNGPYGLVDEWIRDWLENTGENSDSNFPMEL